MYQSLRRDRVAPPNMSDVVVH